VKTGKSRRIHTFVECVRLEQIRREMSSVGNRTVASGCGEKRRDCFDKPLAGRTVVEGTLPDGDNMPTELEECIFMTEVTCLVFLENGVIY
jgi:hypothetical protein